MCGYEWTRSLVLQEEILVGETLEELRQDALHDFRNGHMNRRLQFAPNIRPVLVQELIQICAQRLVAIEQVRQLNVHSARTRNKTIINIDRKTSAIALSGSLLLWLHKNLELIHAKMRASIVHSCARLEFNRELGIMQSNIGITIAADR